MRCALVIEYDGTEFNGWQVQPSAPSVQKCVERALSLVADHEIKTVCAGRTDSGVHAIGQVVHFDTDVSRSPRSWCLGANSNLPSAVSVVWAGAVPEEFNARFSAIERTYRYRIVNRSSRASIDSRFAWTVPRRLDIARMRLAARLMIGKHDFSAFRSADCQAKTATRVLTQLDIEAFGDQVVVRVSANAFLQNMVRIITGVLVAVGTGDREPEWAAELLSHGDRTLGGVTVPACGLSLVRVRYPARFDIPLRRDPFIMSR